ncbi:MAG: response regulator [Spirochaetaceae bacterium]|jgi:putative two-component system response regulator|nr:response regulator [Spirochaetaceae bacterium]
MIKNSRVVIIDDSQTSIDLIKGFLRKEGYILEGVKGGLDGLKRVLQHPKPDLVLLDIKMSDLNGFEVCRSIRNHPKTHDIPVIFVTSLNDAGNETYGLKMGANDYIVKPLNAGLTRIRVRHQLELRLAEEELEEQRDKLETQVQEKTRELDITQDITIECMATLAEKRDNDSSLHITRTRQYIKVICQRLKDHPEYKNLSEKELDLFSKSAMLHDIGKVGIPDEVLQKTETLTKEEFEILKLHTKYGRDALLEAEKTLGSTSYLTYAREIAYTHHERWDGTGYPEGLKGKGIPLSGRLMGIVDVFDTLISKKVYKEATPHDEALEFIRSEAGKLFDPLLVEVFLDCKENILKIALENPDDDKQKIYGSA